jgi:hypothetical protein
MDAKQECHYLDCSMERQRPRLFGCNKRLRGRPHAAVRSLHHTYKHTHTHNTNTATRRLLAHIPHKSSTHDASHSSVLTRHISANLTTTVQNTAAAHLPCRTVSLTLSDPLRRRASAVAPHDLRSQRNDSNTNINSHSGCSGGKQDQVYGPPGY